VHLSNSHACYRHHPHHCSCFIHFIYTLIKLVNMQLSQVLCCIVLDLCILICNFLRSSIQKCSNLCSYLNYSMDANFDKSMKIKAGVFAVRCHPQGLSQDVLNDCLQFRGRNVAIMQYISVENCSKYLHVSEGPSAGF
jgi:hypothetical protein